MALWSDRECPLVLRSAVRDLERRFRKTTGKTKRQPKVAAPIAVASAKELDCVLFAKRTTRQEVRDFKSMLPLLLYRSLVPAPDDRTVPIREVVEAIVSLEWLGWPAQEVEAVETFLLEGLRSLARQPYRANDEVRVERWMFAVAESGIGVEAFLKMWSAEHANDAAVYACGLLLSQWINIRDFGRVRLSRDPSPSDSAQTAERLITSWLLSDAWLARWQTLEQSHPNSFPSIAKVLALRSERLDAPPPTGS